MFVNFNEFYIYFAGQIIVEKLKTGVIRGDNDPDFVDVALDLDSGLGIFDAFFASFSMILVSEVSGSTFMFFY